MIHFTSGCSNTVGNIPQNYKSSMQRIKSISTLETRHISRGFFSLFSPKSIVIPALREMAKFDVDK